MSVGPEAVGGDYLHFWETWLTDDVDERRTELAWRLLGAEPVRGLIAVARAPS